MADEAIKYLDVKEFREFGYLQEVNRRFFHPLGLALSVNVDDETGEETLGGIWDYREDPEGIVYAGGYGADADKTVRVTEEWFQRQQARIDATGFMVQEPGQEPKAAA